MVKLGSFSELASNIPFRWPKKGDRLLRKSKDWRSGADFDANVHNRHVHIWSGYMRSGAALVAECERSPSDRHFLIYPILFNYRHGLELAIKWIIDNYGRYANVSLGADDLNHDLWQLWKSCERVILEVGSTGPDDAIKAVAQIVKDFHDCDRGAMSFRYAKTNAGAAISLPEISIDLTNVRNVMEGVDNFFSGVDGELSANSSAVDW